jgi:hypothetical protein
VIYFRAFHQHIIVLSSQEDCAELLDKRSTLHSGRPVIPMIELCVSLLDMPLYYTYEFIITADWDGILPLP